ncbi:F0F1 ATP synthase subunit A [Moheibacter lacus]|uniref:ATP synthase subunit a n=1 Tax=Moheibacter lacus TaxID=2745851 RepID=A0A838ZPQ6_9FLAO|nr:F0F1 ATP synthase subunit A [Moheibacter lacus]MBA5628865.1 F0F1 ATP synthase subunit A [Moheibacter lacus]
MRQLFTLCFVLVFQMFAFASPNGHEVADGQLSEKESMRKEVKEVIGHHLMDSHDFTFLGDKEGHYYGFPLPVILFDNGLKIFSSSEFDHGKNVVEKDGSYYKLYHGKIYKTDAAGTIDKVDKVVKEGMFGMFGEPLKDKTTGEVVIKKDAKGNPEKVITNEKPLDMSITKNVVMIILTGLLMLWLFGSLAKSYAKTGGVPKGVGRFFEPIVMYIKDEIAVPNIGEKHYKKYMPFLLTVFFFIWILNMFGLTPLGVNVTGNIAFTFALAIMTFLITNFTGKKDYWLHIFDPLGDSMPWYAKVPLYIILIPIEILGIFIKPFSLLIRLYANMAAGHIVLMSLIGLIFIFQSWIGGTLSFALTFVIVLIKVLVALLQAYIFTMLSALYFGFASAEHAHEHEEAH